TEAAVIGKALKGNIPIYTIGVGEPGKNEEVTTMPVLDRSASMQQPADDNDKISKMAALKAAAKRFIHHMRPGARTTLLPFSSEVQPPGPLRSKTEAGRLEAAIDELVPAGETALFDAVYTAIASLEAQRAPGKQVLGKRAVVVLTDGIDNSSRRR